MLQNLNICIDDLPAEAMIEGKNKKKYINLTVTSLREPDNFGNDLSVYIQQSKEDRTAGKPKQYVGNGKSVISQSKPATNGNS